jgi:hypothetical protein
MNTPVTPRKARPVSRPRSNELARSGHTPLGEHAQPHAAPRPSDEEGRTGQVPPENRPGNRPAVDQDKPVEAFAQRFPTGPNDDA